MAAHAKPAALHRRFGGAIVRWLVRGAILLLPLLVTYWLLKFAFDQMDGLLQPVISAIFGRELVGLSFAIVVVAVLAVGAVGSTRVFRWVGRMVERGITSTPGIGAIYSTSKKLIPGSDQGKDAMGFDKVVRVEYPRRGVWSVGFLMGVVEDGDGARYGIVYMPSTPMPQSGWLVQVPLSEIQEVDWPSGVAMQYIVSAGINSPGTMRLGPMEGSP